MRTAAECRQCAEKCRALLSRDLSDDQRRLVLAMAHIWEALARERERQPQGHAEPERLNS